MFVVAVAGLGVAFSFGGSAGAMPSKESTTTRNEGEFCGPRVARDFLQPFAKMRSIHYVPKTGKLSFAPKGLTLEARGGRLRVGGGWVGFGISDEAIGQVRRLNWDVSAQLFEVNSKGAVVTKLGSKRRRIGTIEGNRIEDLLFQLSAGPAYYRVDISFRRSRSDHILGKFSNYVRVVRPWFDARLLMLGSTARQGGLMSVRLANFGTETISSLSHDWRFAVQYFNGQNWVEAPSNPPPEKHKAIISKLAAGQMDQCVHLRVPADEVPGLYRFAMVVNRSSKSTEDRAVQLTAEFEVSGRSLK